MNDEMQQFSVDVPFREKISRLFIFRGLWVYILIFPLIPLGIWFGLVMFLHFWYMLFLGKRNQFLWDNQKKLFVWMTKWQAYLNYLVDLRPGFWW